MKSKRLTDRGARLRARYERDAQWAFMERVAREGIVWMCPWDKYARHGKRCAIEWCRSRTFTPQGDIWQCAFGHATSEIPDDGVYVFGLIGCNEVFYWLDSHKDWWKHGDWSDERCARSISITDAGREALKNQYLYDGELISGGMVEPGYVVKPWPRKKAE